jgi:ribosomal-protein-alanine N-acetyltransferase
MLFETERLYVRELNKSDTELFAKMQGNANVMKYVTGRPKTKEESINELEKIIHIDKKTNREFIIMAVVRKDSNKFVGTCAVIKNDDGEHEIGYRFIEEYWGNGYGKEVVGGLIKFAFQTLSLKQIVAHVNKENYPSIKILHSLNFHFIREYRESETGDLVSYYKISKLDYKE